MQLPSHLVLLLLVLAGPGLGKAAEAAARPPGAAGLSDLAQRHLPVHRFSVLFTAQDVGQRLATDAGMDAALDWCRCTAVSKVYLETFRDGYQADRERLQQAKARFAAAGLAVSGCVTTTQVGKSSTGWKNTVSCYTDPATQAKVRALFEYAAGLFDEIMIDDFWFTDCTCADCDAARKARTVKIGDRTFAVAGDTWEDFRCELMVQLSRAHVQAAAKRVNPRATLILKYPQWYDDFHNRGYDVLRQTADFDRIWVGTETRDYHDRRWGGTAPYAAYFLMRWLGNLGGAKCGGGWYDWLGTSPATYVEQARQTILGGARESFLFCYGGLQSDTGPADIAALRARQPELFAVARQVATRQVVGVAAYKPAHSHPEQEARVFDFVGMLGVPLVPCHQFPEDAPAAFFSVHALKDARLPDRLAAFIRSGKPVVLTDGLAERLRGRVQLGATNVQVWAVRGSPKSLLAWPQDKVDALRAPLVRPFAVRLRAPVGVAFYPFRDGSWVLENFRDEPAEAELNGQLRTLPARGWACEWRQ